MKFLFLLNIGIVLYKAQITPQQSEAGLDMSKNQALIEPNNFNYEIKSQSYSKYYNPSSSSLSVTTPSSSTSGDISTTSTTPDPSTSDSTPTLTSTDNVNQTLTSATPDPSTSDSTPTLTSTDNENQTLTSISPIPIQSETSKTFGGTYPPFSTSISSFFPPFFPPYRPPFICKPLPTKNDNDYWAVELLPNSAKNVVKSVLQAQGFITYPTATSSTTKPTIKPTTSNSKTSYTHTYPY